jgi:hypothetical protein
MAMRTFTFVAAVGAALAVMGCGTKSAGILYVTPADHGFPAPRADVLAVVLATLNELGMAPDFAQELAGMTLVTTAPIQRSQAGGEAIRCRRNWRGIFSGGWVEEDGN